ncbi:MAG: hypothetical protein HYV59_14570 [Planctomycetes bacterium]|nr:hypothetical protein [Planctomycetota bacterium]
MSHKFPGSFLLLQQEGYLIESCLTSGLTNLRKAHVHNKGGFYSALFNLSIGIERLLKAILIIDHMLQNNLSSPSKKQLKGYGHRLIDLYNSVFGVANREGVAVADFDSLDSINQNILNLLSNFAQSTRYYNLDSLDSRQLCKDPLSHWGEIIFAILNQDVSEKQRTRVLSKAGIIAKLIESKTMVLMHGLDQKPLTLESTFSLPSLHELAVKHAVLRLVSVLCPLRKLVRSLCHKTYGLGRTAPPIPQMQEFLEWLWDDRQYVLRKKKWP